MPADDLYHYLKNWDWSHTDADTATPAPFAGNETLPVTYIGMDEARAYCAAVGKRLPREEEWLFAATGGGASEQPYPWGFAEVDFSKTNIYAPVQITGTLRVFRQRFTLEECH
jgi:formylglycine-generating enzyme required for sulfatase activity